MVSNIIFFILAFVAVVSSFMAVTSQKIIRSAVFLLFVLLSTAGFYFLLDYHFLAITQIAVYAGGVMVLFIFSIVLTNQPGVGVKFEKPKRMIVAAIAALAGLAICGHIVYYNISRLYFYTTQEEFKMQDIGFGLLGTGKYQNMLPFEAVSLLLLACIIGGVMIARKR
ncbi:MAG: NADH dehydrogenase [Bacteroidales bacterium 45-6]|nr:MAG: NADH dehydrogenase [Bacteroidales bacterium 45-6]